jgi:hypothetical protein
VDVQEFAEWLTNVNATITVGLLGIRNGVSHCHHEAKFLLFPRVQGLYGLVVR